MNIGLIQVRPIAFIARAAKSDHVGECGGIARAAKSEHDVT